MIHVRMSYLQSSCEASIEVTDQGKGVTPVQAREIFNLAKASSTTDGSGNGIGLKATLTYISGLGGTCGADGATFWIKFPLKRNGINGLSIHGELCSDCIFVLAVSTIQIFIYISILHIFTIFMDTLILSFLITFLITNTTGASFQSFRAERIFFATRTKNVSPLGIYFTLISFISYISQ